MVGMATMGASTMNILSFDSEISKDSKGITKIGAK
jgi:hypothetical protein